MIKDQLRHEFPNLSTSSFEVTSPQTQCYNCIAWAACDDTRWWWPSPFAYWPSSVPQEETLDAFVAAFMVLGFHNCDSTALEYGFEKIGIYADSNDKPTHAARQLSNGEWTSKLGKGVDIRHAISGVDGKNYGSMRIVMKRAI